MSQKAAIDGKTEQVREAEPTKRRLLQPNMSGESGAVHGKEKKNKRQSFSRILMDLVDEELSCQ